MGSNNGRREILESSLTRTKLKNIIRDLEIRRVNGPNIKIEDKFFSPKELEKEKERQEAIWRQDLDNLIFRAYKHLSFIVLVSLLFVGTAIGAPRPNVKAYYYGYFENELGGSKEDKINSIRKSVRLFKKKTGHKINLRTKRIGGVLLDVYFGCTFWSSTPRGCILSLYEELKLQNTYSKNKTAHYFVVPPIKYEGTYWIGGAAITGCYKDLKWKREMNYLSGIGYGNYLKSQVNGSSRVTQSEAVIIHELGHLVYGLSHDGEEENFIMNSLFNAKGFSSLSAPELWQFSEKSKKEIRRCRNGE